MEQQKQKREMFLAAGSVNHRSIRHYQNLSHESAGTPSVSAGRDRATAAAVVSSSSITESPEISVCRNCYSLNSLHDRSCLETLSGLHESYRQYDIKERKDFLEALSLVLSVEAHRHIASDSSNVKDVSEISTDDISEKNDRVEGVRAADGSNASGTGSVQKKLEGRWNDMLSSMDQLLESIWNKGQNGSCADENTCSGVICANPEAPDELNHAGPSCEALSSKGGKTQGSVSKSMTADDDLPDTAAIQSVSKSTAPSSDEKIAQNTHVSSDAQSKNAVGSLHSSHTESWKRKVPVQCEVLKEEMPAVLLKDTDVDDHDRSGLRNDRDRALNLSAMNAAANASIENTAGHSGKESEQLSSETLLEKKVNHNDATCSSQYDGSRVESVQGEIIMKVEQAYQSASHSIPELQGPLQLCLAEMNADIVGRFRPMSDEVSPQAKDDETDKFSLQARRHISEKVGEPVIKGQLIHPIEEGLFRAEGKNHCATLSEFFSQPLTLQDPPKISSEFVSSSPLLTAAAETIKPSTTVYERNEAKSNDSAFSVNAITEPGREEGCYNDEQRFNKSGGYLQVKKAEASSSGDIRCFSMEEEKAVSPQNHRDSFREVTIQSEKENLVRSAGESTVRVAENKQTVVRQEQASVQNVATSIESVIKKSQGDNWTGNEMAAKLIYLLMKASSTFTFEHSSRVIDLSADLAHEIGVTDEKQLKSIKDGAMFHDLGEVELDLRGSSPKEQSRLSKYIDAVDLKNCSFLHDIGKVKIPDSILYKPGRLTDEEFNILKQHPVIGEEILKPIPSMSHVLPVVRHHHEKWDGKGYPDGIAREQIPLEARIVGLTDAYDAMVSDRPYRKGMPVRDAVAELKRCAGTHFDPYLVDAFIRMVERDKDKDIQQEQASSQQRRSRNKSTLS